MHTLSFDESNDWQKKLALYSGSICSEKISESLEISHELRLDFLDLPEDTSRGKIALTILPGRKDRNRNTKKDIESIQKNKINSILCLITEQEFEDYGVQDLKEEYKNFNLDAKYFPILDQKVPDFVSMQKNVSWMEEVLSKKQNLLVHCVGGLGRTGTVIACYLVEILGLSANESIKLVRKSRSARAIETDEQESFIYDYEKRLGNGSKIKK